MVQRKSVEEEGSGVEEKGSGAEEGGEWRKEGRRLEGGEKSRGGE